MLTNGRRIEADRVWIDGTQVRYEKGGGAYGLPRSLVKDIERVGALLPSPAPARPGTPPTSAPAAERPPQFRIRYEGGVDETLGIGVLRILARAFEDHARLLSFRPEDPITVVLQTSATLPDGTPPWVASVNDGTIRVPVAGFDAASPRLTALLRHELAHTFLRARTGGNCPTWIQEGVSQWLEGGDATRQDGAASAALADGRLLPLLTLEAPFQTLGEEDVPVAYAESLSAVAHLLRLKGPQGIVRLLAVLADRVPSEEALPIAFGVSYPELQRGWEAHLRRIVPQR